MNLRMHENSLFAVLMRSSWWVSFAIAAGIFAIARLVIPEAYRIYAVFAALPFLVIGGIVLFKQLRAPSAARVAATLDAVRTMSWNDFSAAIEDAFRRDGYSVSRVNDAAADFMLIKAGRVSIVSCKRWKVARAGIEPLRDLYAAKDKHEAHECVYVAANELSDNARTFAAKQKIRLMGGGELARLLPRIGRDK